MHINEKLSEQDLELNNLLDSWVALPTNPEMTELTTESASCTGFARPVSKELIKLVTDVVAGDGYNRSTVKEEDHAA